MPMLAARGLPEFSPMPNPKTAASLSRLRKRLERVPLEVRAAAAAQALIEATGLAAGIRYAAPKDDGALAESVRVEQGKFGDRFYVKAGGPKTTRPVRDGASTTYDYALGQEFGTAKMPANPFFYAPYRHRRKSIRENISKAALRAAQRFNGQGSE